MSNEGKKIKGVGAGGANTNYYGKSLKKNE